MFDNLESRKNGVKYVKLRKEKENWLLKKQKTRDFLHRGEIENG